MRRTLLTWVGGIAAFIALLFVVVYGLGGFQRLTANFRGETSQIEKTRADGQYRIANYDHFFDLCASVQAAEDRIKNQEAELETVTDPLRKAQVETNLIAQRNQRDTLIRQYNADARKEATAGQFRDSSLPYQLDTNQEITTCDA